MEAERSCIGNRDELLLWSPDAEIPWQQGKYAELGRNSM
jgi:hypothetical protein